MARKQVIYGVDDKPPFPVMVLAGAQHVLTLFGATTLVPLIFGPAMGMDAMQIASFISCVYFGMGIATLIQTHPKLGSGLPIVQGSSFSFIPSVMTIIGAYKAMGPDVIMQYIGGGLIAGGIILSFIGYSGIIGYIRKVITPVVIGPVIMAIGFSLAPTAIGNAANYWPASLLVVFLIFFFSLVSRNKYANIFAILSSIDHLPSLLRPVLGGHFSGGASGPHRSRQGNRCTMAEVQGFHAVGCPQIQPSCLRGTSCRILRCHDRIRW